MLVLVLPVLLLVIVGGIIWSARLIFSPPPLANVNEKAKTRQRGRPNAAQRRRGRL